MMDRIKRELTQITNWIGSTLGALALAWPAIQSSLPDVVQQLAATNPSAAKALNVAVALIGFGLIAYREKHRA